MKILINTSYDALYNTWNAFLDGTGSCVFFGTIEQLEAWLNENDEYEVVE